MTLLHFRRLMAREQEMAALVSELLTTLDAPIQIEDIDGLRLLGAAEDPAMRFPVQLEGDIIGWVAGDPRAATMAHCLTYMVQRIWDRKNLAHEALEKYRELNLLYELNEKVNAALDAPLIAQIAVTEALRLISSSNGALLLIDAASGALEPLCTSEGAVTHAQIGVGIIGAIAATGNAEIVNGVADDPRVAPAETEFAALAVAPLVAKQRVSSVLVLSTRVALTYTAADLKLLKAIAALAAPALDNALTYQAALRAAALREATLRQQIIELHIQVDQTKQAKQVAEITGTEYFEMLRNKAQALRRR